MTFTPTRAAGLAALADFVDRAGHDYAETRNFDRGPGDRANVSMLSPYLRYRLVTESEVVAAVRARHPGETAAKFIQEVFWRTYWKGWLELRPSVWTDYLEDLASLEATSGGWRRDYDRALAGATGIDCFDAWIAELAEFGYLHNHARMWFASIWIFTLRLPWQLGAALFWHYLYDGDAASNTLSWRWVAGLQTAGKTYLAQADNIARYTGGCFTAAGLASRAAAITATPTPAPRPLTMPEPLPTGRIGLLLAEDDLAPETLLPGRTQVDAIAALRCGHGRSPAVEHFIREALGDAGRRAHTSLRADATTLPDATAASVHSWAQAHRLDQIVIAYAPVGPSAAAVATLRDDLRALGVRLTPVRRAWDEHNWPHAQRGFFAFREKCIPLA